jgi:hypothetical protein
MKLVTFVVSRDFGMIFTGTKKYANVEETFAR